MQGSFKAVFSGFKKGATTVSRQSFPAIASVELSQRTQQTRRLVPGFFILALRMRLRHNAAAYGKLPPAASRRDGANQDAQVHRAIEAKVAERAAIGAAGRRLQFG